MTDSTTKADWVIRGALVYDGISREPTVFDVAIMSDRIVAIGPDLPAASREVAAAGLCLAPGFVDVHSHDDFVLFLDPHLPFKALQGVTTEIVGNCGIGPAPSSGSRPWMERFHPGAVFPEFLDTFGYIAAVDEAAPALNIAVLAGHGSLREAAAPGSRGALSRVEQVKLEALYEEAVAAGVVGLSSGLIYEPGCHADEAELIALLRRGREMAPLYTTHLRNEADHLLLAVEEAIRIADAAGVGLQLSHHKAHGRNNWGRVKDSLALVDRALERGLDVALDVYPYTAGSTILSAIVEGLGGSSRLGKLDPEDVVVATMSGHEELEGSNLADLMRRWSVSKEEAAAEVLRLDPGAWVIIHAMSEDDVETVIRHPRTLFGSDGIPTTAGRPHPRLYGTFPRVLGHYTRERGLLVLGETIRRLTSVAAARFGLVDRGAIRPGAFADLVLFDAASVLDQATYEDPRRPPPGIEAVWVNGRRVVEGGRHTGERPGRALRRGVS